MFAGGRNVHSKSSLNDDSLCVGCKKTRRSTSVEPLCVEFSWSHTGLEVKSVWRWSCTLLSRPLAKQRERHSCASSWVCQSKSRGLGKHPLRKELYRKTAAGPSSLQTRQPRFGSLQRTIAWASGLKGFQAQTTQGMPCREETHRGRSKLEPGVLKLCGPSLQSGDLPLLASQAI